jgi:hypothetical protein
MRQPLVKSRYIERAISWQGLGYRSKEVAKRRDSLGASPEKYYTFCNGLLSECLQGTKQVHATLSLRAMEIDRDEFRWIEHKSSHTSSST